MSNEKKRRLFSFDLYIKKLDQLYAAKWYTEGYGKISDYLFSHGFDADRKKQGSVYFTTEEYMYNEVMEIVMDMFDKLPWLSECMRLCSLDEVREPDMSIMEYLEKFNKTPEHKKQLDEYHEIEGWYNNPNKEIETEELTRGKSR